MAVLTNTFLTSSAVANREELHDFVSRIDLSKTPIYSMIGKASFATTNPQWLTDSFAAPAENVVPEGDEYTFAAITPAVRVKTYTQILRKEGVMSRSQNENDNAGDIETIKEQKVKRAVELKRDVERSIVAANASVGGTTRKSGSLSTWITSNVSRGSGGANGGYNSGTGLTVAPTNGTQRAFTKALLDNVMQQGAVNGAEFGHIVGSHYIKSVFATFMSDANVAAFRYAANTSNKNTAIGTVDAYLGPHGEVMFHDNYVMSGEAGLARNVFLVDPEYAEWGWYRKIQQDKRIAASGDNEKFVIIGEGALKTKNEKGLGVVADVYGLTASS